MDALKLLKKDNDTVADLFTAMDDADDNQQKLKIFQQINSELITHTHIEEAILYPACMKHDELKAMILEALEEHKQIKTLLHAASELTNASDKFEAKVKVTKEDVEHHVKDEEKELFPKIRKVMTDEQLEEMGLALEAEKEKAK